MQRLFAFALLCFLLSCKSNDKPKGPVADNWVLSEKKTYDYRLNSVGYADTVFVQTHKYENGMVKDSTVSFIVYRYLNNKLTDEVSYAVNAGSKAAEEATKKYIYNTKGTATGFNVYQNGKLIRSENYSYNDSNQVTKQVLILPRNADGSPAQNGSGTGYDTITAAYRYDDAKKIIGTIFKDQYGNVLRNDLNVYSGNMPLLSYSTNPKGDTLQKITYEQNGKILHTSIENDSVVLIQNTMNGIQVAQMTVHKKKNQKWRSAISYDEKGRPKQEVLYKAS